MKLIETILTETAVRMRYADAHDPAKATQWIDFQVPLADLKDPSTPQETPLGNPETEFLAAVRLAALRRARTVIAAETQRLSELAKSTF